MAALRRDARPLGDLTAPESHGLSSAATVTLWPGHGAVLPVEGGGNVCEPALAFVVQQIAKRANPFAAFAALPFDRSHPGAVLPPGQYRWRRFVSVPGTWVLAIQWVTNAFGELPSTTLEGWKVDTGFRRARTLPRCSGTKSF